MNALRDYLLNVLLGLDQLATTLIGGYPDETLSSYAFRLNALGKPWGFTMHVIDALFFWQEEHCRLAYESEVERRQLPPLFRR